MKSRKWRSLLHKVEYLKLDLEEKEEAVREIEASFLSRLHELVPSDSDPVESDPPKEEKRPSAPRMDVVGGEERADATVPSEEVGGESDERPEDMRKVWRSIAVATHPDKTGGDLRKTELYKRASGAWDGRRYEELISIALELGLDVGEGGEGSETLLEVRSKEISDRISRIEGSVLWQWHRAPPDKKDEIVRFYAASRKRTKG